MSEERQNLLKWSMVHSHAESSIAGRLCIGKHLGVRIGRGHIAHPQGIKKWYSLFAQEPIIL
jgi:hypothetical protein